MNLFGNATFANETVFDISPMLCRCCTHYTCYERNRRQSINEVNNNSKYIFLFRLQRDSINTSDTITLNAGLYLGNHAGGGLRLNQGAATNTILDIEDCISCIVAWRCFNSNCKWEGSHLQAAVAAFSSTGQTQVLRP